MMTGYECGGIGMMGPFAWIRGIAILVLIVLAIMWLWRSLDLGRGGGPKSTTEVTDHALQTARERYAKGEIDSQEFERVRRDLSS